MTWISHGVTCIPHPDPPIPLGLPSAPGMSTCLMHPTWAGPLGHHRWKEGNYFILFWFNENLWITGLRSQFTEVIMALTWMTIRFSMNSHANCSLALKFKVEKISYTRRKWYGCSWQNITFALKQVKGISFPGGSDNKESTCDAGGPGSVPGLGRSPAEGSGNPLQYSCLENPMDREAWWAPVHGVA